MGALWRPLGLPHFLVCATRVLQWGSNKRPKQFKNKWFGTFFWDPFGETNLDHPAQKHVPMQRGARFIFSGSVLMQRGARCWIFDVPLGTPTWPSEGVQNIYKTNAFLYILNRNRKRRVRQERMREHSHAAWRSH